MDKIASTRPLSTSSNAASTTRAKKGIAPNVIGTMAAVLPSVVPIIQRVMGIKAMSNTTKGIERPTLTSAPIKVFSRGAGSTPAGRETNSKTPMANQSIR